MSVAFAVSDIIERIRTRADLPAFSSNTNVTSAMVLAMVQESVRDLSALLDDTDWYFVGTYAVSATAGSPYVSMPLNASNLIQVTWDKDSSTSIALESAALEDVDTQPTGSWNACAPRFRLAGNVLELFPTPDAAYALTIRHSTGLTVSSAADTLFGQSGWDTWVIYNCCCIIRQRQDRDYSVFSAERDRKLGEVMARARRERGVVKRPRDVRSGRASSRLPWPWGSR